MYSKYSLYSSGFLPGLPVTLGFRQYCPWVPPEATEKLLSVVIFLISMCKYVRSRGVIRRGRSLLAKIIAYSGGSAPLKSLYWPCFSKCIDLASKVFCIAMINYSLLYGN